MTLESLLEVGEKVNFESLLSYFGVDTPGGHLLHKRCPTNIL